MGRSSMEKLQPQTKKTKQVKGTCIPLPKSDVYSVADHTYTYATPNWCTWYRIPEMWDVEDLGCQGCRMFRMWDVSDVQSTGCWMLEMWDVGCGIFVGMWDVDLQNAIIRYKDKMRTFWGLQPNEQQDEISWTLTKQNCTRNIFVKLAYFAIKFKSNLNTKDKFKENH